MTWIAQELATANFGDIRLTRRLQRIITDKLAHPTASIPEASGDWAATKATYRFLDSAQVTPAAIRATHRDATLRRMQDHAQLLVLQDTTELDYTDHPATTGLGHLDHPKRQGLKVHSGLAATVDGLPLGLVYQTVWRRDAATKGQKRRSRPPEQKESQRWMTTLREVQTVVPPPTQVVVVADREADLYPLFAIEREPRIDLVVRAAYNRSLAGEPARLEAAAAQVVPVDTLSVEIPANGTRPARTASVTIGWTTIHMAPPTDYAQRAARPHPTLQLVVVRESAPVPGIKPLRWLLLTSLAVTTWAEAVSVVGYYRARWLIERYHYVLKSGCGIERLQLETAERLERALAICSIVAWRLLWLTYVARQQPDQPCTTILATPEWQALYCTHHRTTSPPRDPPSVRDALRWIAQLGGFLARRGDGEPGVKVIWRGLRRLDDIVATWVLLHGSEPIHPDAGLMGNG